MLKVMTIIGTRPELVKMSRTIAEFDLHTQHVLVHTGQNFDYELNQIFFDDLQIRKPDYFLDAAGENPLHTIAQIIAKSYEVMRLEEPDAILLYGDTNSGLAVISAKRLKIPVFHMEAGNRSFDQRIPEELNRKIIDHLSDINLVLSEHARRYLIAEGIPPEMIIKTGSHMREVLDFYMPRIKASTILESMKLQPKQYFLVSAHREENIDSPENLADLVETLNVLAYQYDIPVIVSTHPRMQKRLDTLTLTALNPHILFMKPFGFADYIKLQMEALCVISDSGTITEETALLGLTAITIRNAHERPEGMDSGTLIMSGLRKDRVLDTLKITLSQNKQETFKLGKVDDYEKGQAVSQQILRIVLSYTDYINHNVWSK